MGNVYAEITLKNAGDSMIASRGMMNEDEVRSVDVTAMVDTGAMTLIIPEEIREQLGLRIERLKKVWLANDQSEIASVTEPVEVHWNDRDYIGSALVLSGRGEILLGLLPLESMDLMVDPVNQRLVGANGDEPMGFAVGVRVK